MKDATFAADQGFTVFFDRAIYIQLESPPPPVNGDWNAITVQPDPLLNSDGFYDALALQSNPSLADPFKVGFVWLSASAPGPQPFVIYDANFQTIAAGLTIPEPSAGALALGSLAIFAARRRRHKIRLGDAETKREINAGRPEKPDDQR